MNLLNEANITVTPQLKSSRSVLIILGVLQILFGFIALSTPWTASVAISEVISILFVITGVVQFFQVIHSHFGSKLRFAVGILISLLYIFAGCFLLFNPEKAVVTITFVIGWFFVIKGAILLTESIRTKKTKGWLIFNAAITLILGLLILIDIQGGALWIIGILVGINLFFTGWTALLLGLSIPKE